MHRVVAFVLFTAVMLAIGWVLKLVVPGFNRWLTDSVGECGSIAFIVAIFVVAAVVGYWPRNEAGRMRPFLPRRR
ncbi:hypothetical protein FV232_00830 [Methylobacterium sp. WL30]|uniref:hypothetical protein n=1 Tax=unclassified Methylobacterium TaxID=2615210 RepID=UPI0011CA4703|nr:MULTISPECIES: hypothetical protein [unclassified Methylobacterium]TXN40505.1 hypothetical protein FV225_06035 [Methylobacterium sp. WL93]TXN52286.1 hypothetical protein FV227_04340 [Methylobacterium sp. WL119]TXN70631.1 hypothetical protein FV232_00830 [Methylobacterium sp. WL30]